MSAVCYSVFSFQIHAFFVPRLKIAAAPPLVAAVESDSIPLQVGAHKALGDRFYSAAIEILVLFLQLLLLPAAANSTPFFLSANGPRVARRNIRAHR